MKRNNLLALTEVRASLFKDNASVILKLPASAASLRLNLTVRALAVLLYLD
jgi:hypothetical protein